MSVLETEFDSELRGEGSARSAGDPFGDLPRVELRQAQLQARLARLSEISDLVAALFGAETQVDPVEVIWRPSAVLRPGLVAQASWPRLATRVALGVETPLAHAVVDQRLGFRRLEAESRLQLTPVEWGVWTFTIATLLAQWRGKPGPFGGWDLVVDRVGPDPFDFKKLGPIITLRWLVRVGAVAGSVRLWLPESLVSFWLAAPVQLSSSRADRILKDPGSLAASWTAEVGSIACPRGLGTLRTGVILPLDRSGLSGSPANVTGLVELTANGSGDEGRWIIPTQPTPYTGGGRLTVLAPVRHISTPREAVALDAAPPTSSAAGAGTPGPADVPVTLSVELGRVSLSLSRLADLRPGDIIELARHSREPVELTSGGRLVARGELVQIDTELGVRVTHVFL